MLNSLTQDKLHILAAAAAAAPSADNCHMFRLEVRGECLCAVATPELIQAPRRRWILAMISMGAVAENMIRRAASLGLQLRLEQHAQDQNEPELLRFVCTAADAAIDPLASAIEARHSNRRFVYRGPPLPPAAQAELSDLETGLDRTHLVWLDEPSIRRKAVRLIRWAETERFRNPLHHGEMFESIHFDAGWSDSTPVGLPPGSLELPWIERPLFALIRHWRVQRAINLIGAHHIIGIRGAALPCRLAPHLCAITAEGSTAQACINSGRMMQRVWLRASQLGLSFQVFAAAALYAMTDGSWVAEPLRARLSEGWQDIAPAKQPVLVFRMGYAPPPSVRAGRLDPSSLLTIP